jgi:hypothetical protein
MMEGKTGNAEGEKVGAPRPMARFVAADNG